MHHTGGTCPRRCMAWNGWEDRVGPANWAESGISLTIMGDQESNLTLLWGDLRKAVERFPRAPSSFWVWGFSSLLPRFPLQEVQSTGEIRSRGFSRLEYTHALC
uniref:Uncharacterized protein n=1 Tax=Fusarium oxysporum (strain Fo5176) TaxID=660025 RepID=A0A0D2X851_FUSOF